MKNPHLTFSSFKQIPPEYTKDNTKLYIRKEAYKQLVLLLKDAERDNISLIVESAFRSISYQKKIFSRMLAEGRSFDDIIRYVAPPGYSTHMLGTAVDFYPSNWRFAATPAYTWLQENAHRYHFYETYPENGANGMPWEAWHWNYNGQ